MFEKPNLSAFAPAHRNASSEALDVDLHVCEAHEADSADEASSLRAIQWSELTARFDAARDFRELLRKDMNAKLGGEPDVADIGFAKAAARFFRANEEDQRAVNHKGLEARKTSSGMYPNVTDETDTQVPHAEPAPTGFSEPGDARDK